MIDFLVVYLIFEGNLSNHFVILIENNVRCMFQAQTRHQSLHHPFPADERATDALNPKNPKPGVTKTVPGHPAPARSCLPT